MQVTKNYGLIKQELTDAADITQISQNWDKIDTEVKALDDNKFDKVGGTIAGATTVNGKITAKGGESVEGGLTVTGGTTTDTFKATGAITVGSVTTSGGVSAGSMTVTGDATVSGKVLVDNIRAKTGSNALQVGVNNPTNAEELLGMIIQWVSGNPRISLTHNPDKAANDKQIPTTNWVKSLIATQSEYGLVRLASEEDVLNETPQNAVCTELIYDINEFRRKSKAYSVGEKVDCAFQYERFLECTKAGTTSANLLDTRNVTHGQVIVDGTVEWTVRTHARSINGAVADANGNITIESEDYFPSGTQLLFYQSTAPTGWTKVAGVGNCAVKIVENDTGGTHAGLVNFDSVFTNLNTSKVATSGTVGAKQLTVATLVSHNHGIRQYNVTQSMENVLGMPENSTYQFSHVGDNVGATQWTGQSQAHNHTFEGSSHSHSVNLSIKYINVIVCRKD